ncbi:MAG TPA: YCF48-related protein [Pirellulales bacterium]|nr:YCF48-related protein [Pirellulales bacterium]
MAGQGRPRRLGWLAALAIALARGGEAPAQEQAARRRDPYLRSAQEDAELVDVAFVDPRRGWAVGDRGAIWSTVDGGRRWWMQRSGVDCKLECVQFLDAEHGWSAGGIQHPYTHTTRGVLLRTRDGGKSWAQDKGLLLPALKRVKFLSGNVGWALGNPSAMFPGGVFATENGGRTWTPLAGVDSPGWLAADFADARTGALAGRSGALAVARHRELAEARTAPFGLRGLWRLKLAGDGTGWLVGDGGLVFSTADAGLTWQTPARAPAEVTGSEFDWRALEVRGARVWIAGSPGTKVLHSADGGRTWEAFSTAQNLPIHGLSFADNLHGWAVGALGTILATDDGGRTWRRQRSGGTRAALLALYSDAGTVPLELLSRLSANDGYLSAVELLNRRDQEPGQGPIAGLADRAQAALVGAGASAAETAWGFPLRQAGLALSAEQLVDGWDRANDGAGIERIEAHLTRRIRTWRPDVVLTHAASPRGDDRLGHIVNQIVLRAVEQAADATRFPEQIGQMGLDAWQVKKVFGSLPPGQLGTLNLNTAQVANRLGASLADYTAGPRGLIADEYTPGPTMLGFFLHVDTLPQGRGEHDFFSGLTLHPAGEARRQLIETGTQSIDLMKRVAQRNRNLKAILARPDQSDADQSRFLAQIGELTAGLDDASAGQVVYQLARQYHRTGRWPMAAETFNFLVDRHPQHPLAPAALVWLLQYWSSAEAAWRVAHTSPGGAMPASLVEPVELGPGAERLPRVGGAQEASAELPISAAAVNRSGVVQAFDTTIETDRPARALAMGKLLEQRNPALGAEPAVRFPLAVAHRRQGEPRLAERHFAELTRARQHDAWWSSAMFERWLTRPVQLPPKRVAHLTASEKPRLDGRLDDEIWKKAKPLELRSALGDDAEWPGVALIAYDHEFLYLALDCRQAAGAAYPRSDSPRPRDGNLAAHDRVDVFIDIDRDFATAYRLSIDHRGWTGDDCWGDVSWNPTWYVAAGGAGGRWTAEAAISFNELGGQPPAAKQVWALGVQRTVPGVGFQSWTTPAATSVVPEGFGYMLFE